MLGAETVDQLTRLVESMSNSAEQHIGAHKAAAADARLFDEPRGAALLTMLRITDDDHGAVVVYGTHFYAASRCSFSTHPLAS